jgi:hypothetical protein
MFENIMHALIGNSQSPLQNAANGTASMGSAIGSLYNSPGTTATAAIAQQILKKESAPSSRKIFHGTVEVLQVANGYIVNIGRKEGYAYDTYIAETIPEVNERIAAAIVAFQLEGT